uniref:DNA/RNA non-specific endonuclease/pyrophosphatase/phosphodiesterase domain-containing protein n=1 Tax=Anopheles epiroticus TaxID=199890 RepID=A0A182P7R1_9DIPT
MSCCSLRDRSSNGTKQNREHQILGKAISHAQINNNRPSFKVGGVSTKQASKFINSSSYLAKGHLTPDGDAVLDSWAGATYFYINAAPEWQIVNAGNWLRVENAARKVAAQLNDTVHVYSGVYDVLQLPDQKGNPISLSLDEDGAVQVPKWLWKVVVHQPSSK